MGQIRKLSLKARIVVAGTIAIILFVGSLSYFVIGGTNSINVYYSLDNKSNDKQLVKVIDTADKYVYFAIYYFTNSNIASALIAAKRRGLDVIGIMDRDASMNANRATMERLQASGIRILTQRHPEGIMHMKVLVTEHAYATGSYNWTDSATKSNDEVLEIGTNDSVRKKYLEIIKKVLTINQ
ncbi:MAG: phospholipase D-like domain-containing protein [Candidatus Taylorbacteria bacterium]